MQKVLSPNQFLFEQAVLQVLKQGKKHVRVSPFQNIEPQQLIKNNNGNLYLDLYHHYFIAAMTSVKTRELACIKYEKILRENLFDRDHVPQVQLISSILSSCSNTGGSTTGSSHGSANISTSSQQGECLYVVNLIKTILLKTSQPSSQIQLALTYILEGTRNKRFTQFYSSILEQIYNSLLIKLREEPIKRLVHLQLNHMVNEIDYHLSRKSEENLDWLTPKRDENGRKALCIHQLKNGKGKFGKCYICSKQADNYCKDELVPVCSFQCKYKLKELVENEGDKDYFSLMTWLLENLASGDQIIYSFLGRQLPHHNLSLDQIITILKTIISIFTNCAAERLAQHKASLSQPNQPSNSGHYIFKQIQKHSLNIFLYILFNYKHLYQKQLEKYFKVFFFEIVRILELISIKRLKLDQKSSKGSKSQLSASKQSIESTLNLSIDSMGNMQSLNSLSQSNPNVSTYLTYQQQFSNPFLNGLIQILSNEDLFFYIYSSFDCKFFEQNLLAKMMNVISQYAKEQIISKEFGFGVTGSSAYGVFSILKMLTERLVGYQKHSNLRTFNLQEQNRKIEIFLKKYPINQKEVQLKRQLPKIMQLFNKKPIKGITALKKLFSKKSVIKSELIAQIDLSESNIKQSKLSENKQSSQIIEEQKSQQLKESVIIENEYEKDVQQIKRRAEQLERQNLEVSQLSVRQQKPVSLEDMEQSSTGEGKKEEDKMEEVTEEIKMEKIGTKQVEKDQIKTQKKQQSKQEHSIESPSKSEEKQEQKTQTVASPQKKASQKEIVPILPELESFITPKQIAILLRQNVDYDSKLKKIPLFQKQKIAEYLGCTKNPEATKICSQFFKLDEPLYSQLQIDDCLRIEFNYFGLPKQGQQIQIIIDELSKIMLPHSYFESSLHIFQYIYTLLMVQSGHNPNVKENDKVKLQMFLSMVGHIHEVKDKAERDYFRIKQNSLNNLFGWGDMIFDSKYLMNIREEDWVFEQMQPERNQDEKNNSTEERKVIIKENTKIINLKWLMQYIWEYVYISIVNNQKKNSTLGVFQAIVLYGKYGLVGQQFGFVQIFKRSYQHNKSKQSLQSLLRLGIQFNNYLYQWSYLINLSYVLEESNTYHEHIDKIFTNLQFVHKSKLKIFLVALCEFSMAEFKSDKGYNRELFVLRHITEILEYNLIRLESVWEQIWATIEVYFKGICLHPVRQISMAAIDSYKQLTLKIFKLKPVDPSSPTINHASILSTYLYIFQRSNIFTKDLIINILQNVVSSDITSGYEIIYEILNINDSEDKTIVMKVVERLVREVGYGRLTGLEKLHQILIKELRVNVNTVTLIEAILKRLWEVAEVIDKREIWLETMKSVKDIYKMSLNNKLLGFFFKICNKCIIDDVDETEERKRRQSFHAMKSILVKPADQETSKIGQEKQIEREQSPKQSSQQQISLDRQIYQQIVDWLIFLMDSKSQISSPEQSYILIVKQALQHFKAIKSHYIIRYLVGVSGLLNVFSMFINSEYKIVFLLFLREFLKEKLIQGDSYLLIMKQPEKWVEVMQWINEHFKQSIPNDLLAMRKLDEDFRKERKDLIYLPESHHVTSAIPVVNAQTHKIQLIEFSLSAQDFNTKSISNLILLDCVQLLVRKQAISAFKKRLDEPKSPKYIENSQNYTSHRQSMKQSFEKTLNLIYQNLLENYQISRKTNNLLALRNFLWTNGFLLYNTYKDSESNQSQQQQPSLTNQIQREQKNLIKPIPGLHKHEKRTLELILKQLPDEDSYVLNVQVLEDFIICYRLKQQLDEEKMGKKRKRQGSISRGRKISQVIRNDELDGINREKKNSISTSRRPSVASNDSSKQPQSPNKNDQPSSPSGVESTEPTKQQKQIQVIEYQAKLPQSATKPKINIIPSKNPSKQEKSQQNHQLMRQLYLYDVEQWIRMMQGNLLTALKNLLRICQDVHRQENSDTQEKQISSRAKMSHFLLNDQQIVKIFLLCLDLSGEQNCSLTIMRHSNTLMQKLLSSIMSVDIDYGCREEAEMRYQIQQEKNE